MHKVTWDTTGVESRFNLRTLPIEQPPANLDIFFTMKICYFASDRAMARDQEVIPIRKVFFENETGLCPGRFVSGGAKIIANRSHDFWGLYIDQFQLLDKNWARVYNGLQLGRCWRGGE